MTRFLFIIPFVLIASAASAQQGQHDLVAFTEMGPAEPRSVAGAGVLALLRRGR